MTHAEADFFSALLCGAGQWSRAATNREGLHHAMAARPSRTRLVSFCSDLIIPRTVIEDLRGECYNFHSGPPERPGFRPSAFALAQRTSNFGVTFHRLIAQVDAGAIYNTRRFLLPSHAGEEAVDLITYQHLIELAKDVAPLLIDFEHLFQPNGETWVGPWTTRNDYEALRSLEGKTARVRNGIEE